jgi:FG-GAP repeat protein
MYAAKSRGIARHIIVLSLLTFLGMTAAIYRPWRKADGAKTNPGMPTLRGEAALTHLKEQRLYSSLGEAVKAARYNVQPLPSSLLAQSARLTAGDGSAEDYFAAAVAISGDTAIVGAPRNDINGCVGWRQYQIIVN